MVNNKRNSFKDYDTFVNLFGTHEDQGKTYNAWYKFCYRKLRSEQYNKRQAEIYRKKYKEDDEFRRSEIKRVSPYVKKKYQEKKILKEQELEKLKELQDLENEGIIEGSEILEEDREEEIEENC